MKFQVSVIIPTFNRNEKCMRAIKSALAQTVPCEIIVVDDGSTPPLAIDEKIYKYTIHTLSLIQSPTNKGPSAARNLGVLAANCEYIAFLDSDDQWNPLKIQKQLSIIDEINQDRDCVILCGWNIERKGQIFQKRIPRKPNSYIDHFKGCWYAPGSGSLMKKTTFKKVGLYDESIKCLEDYEWYLRFAYMGGDILVAKESLMTISRDNQRINNQVKDASIKIWKNYRRNLKLIELVILSSYLFLELAAMESKKKIGYHLWYSLR